MDEIIMRRLRHLQWLEENHVRDFQERFGRGKTLAERRNEDMANVISADWNKKRKLTPETGTNRVLPHGWRKEHWKTQQSMAADYAGVEVATKAEAIRALEVYEAELVPPSAA